MNRSGKSIEILAPVGGQEQLVAAVRSGADAVYFGLQDFNARRNAENFAGEGLKDTVAYCHLHGVKVYITINTLVKDEELAAVKRAVDTAGSAAVDALIVQDLAVASYARQAWPGLPLFASTQMACVNEAGARQLAEMGFSRVVLARELSLAEIKRVISRTGVEAEVFVHGAHCMSVSGACYLSSVIGARSGNRGLCAQPCRLDWHLGGKDYALSLKDLSYVERLKELEAAGVASVKIEGRMKRAEYVAASVTACRDALDGRKPDMETLRAVFSRSGFTDGHLSGRRGPEMFGIRTKEDVTAASDVLPRLAKIYEKEPQSVAVDMYLSAHEGEPSVLTVIESETGRAVTAEGPVPEKARSLPLSEEYAARSLSKTGGSMYCMDSLSLDAGDGLMLPASALNAMRRDALAQLDAARIEENTPEYAKRGKVEASSGARSTAVGTAAPAGSAAKTTGAASHAGTAPRLRLRFERAEQLFEPAPGEDLMLPLWEIEKHPELLGRFGDRLICELPLIWPEDEDRTAERLKKLMEKGLARAYAMNIGSVRTALALGLRVSGGPELNILNSEALAEAEALGLEDLCASFEISAAGMGRLAHAKPLAAIGYGRLPLMKLRACPMRGEKGCGACSGLNFMTDRTETDFPLICRERKYSELLNSVPLYAGDRALPADIHIMYFTLESKEECFAIAETYRRGEPFEGRRTGGLYFRKLL